MMLALWLAALPTALPCGGPEAYMLDAPLVPVSVHVDDWLHAGWYEGEDPEPVTTFLYPFQVSDPPLYAALEASRASWYESGAPTPAPAAEAPDLTRFHQALQAGDLTTAQHEAERAVEAVMDLPAPVARGYDEELRLAVEFIEVRPGLGGVPSDVVAAWFASTRAVPALKSVAQVRGMDPADATPDATGLRAASIRWLWLRHALTAGVPDGFSADEIRQAYARPPWRNDGFASLQAALDAWLHDFPDHPLADLVRLKKVRLYYLAGNADAAWAILLEMYPRHPARVAEELRFLTVHGVVPTKLDPALFPPEVRVGLADSDPLTADEWSALWHRSESAMNGRHPAPWALPVQEALLLTTAVRGEPLPAAFPAVAAAPSATWAKLRLAALVRVGRDAEAEAQLAKIDPSDALVAPVAARIKLGRGDWVGAIDTPGLDPASMRYLVRILAPVEALRSLQGDGNATIRWEARMAIASRQLASGGDWDAGARLLDEVDPDRAALWREAGRLAHDTSPDGVLAYARFLRENGGAIFVGCDYDEVVWYRSLPMDAPPGARQTEARLGLTPGQEWEATRAWLLRSFSTWYSLQAYARWLEDPRHPPAQERAVLDETDRTYNLLLNYGSGSWHAWGQVLPQSQVAKDIRAAGKAIRAKAPKR